MDFKEQLKSDLENIFLNTNEFGEIALYSDNVNTYPNIQCLIFEERTEYSHHFKLVMSKGVTDGLSVYTERLITTKGIITLKGIVYSIVSVDLDEYEHMFHLIIQKGKN